MTEKIKELRDTLAHLHEQLESEAPIAVETRALLQEAMLEISDALERASADSASTTASTAGSDEEPSLLDRLSQMAEEFEESHPAISAAVGRVATALSNLGI